MSGVADTSIQAFWEEKLSFRIGKQAAAVLDNISIYGPGTRTELAQRCGLKINVICGRVSELRALGVVQDDEVKVDPLTKKKVHVVALRETKCRAY